MFSPKFSSYLKPVPTFAGELPVVLAAALVVAHHAHDVLPVLVLHHRVQTRVGGGRRGRGGRAVQVPPVLVLVQGVTIVTTYRVFVWSPGPWRGCWGSPCPDLATRRLLPLLHRREEPPGSSPRHLGYSTGSFIVTPILAL